MEPGKLFCFCFGPCPLTYCTCIPHSSISIHIISELSTPSCSGRTRSGPRPKYSRKSFFPLSRLVVAFESWLLIFPHRGRPLLESFTYIYRARGLLVFSQRYKSASPCASVCARRSKKKKTRRGWPAIRSNIGPFCPASRQTCIKHKNASTGTDCLVFIIGRISSFPYLTPMRGVCLTWRVVPRRSYKLYIRDTRSYCTTSLDIQNCAIHHRISAAVALFSDPSCLFCPLTQRHLNQDVSHV